MGVVFAAGDGVVVEPGGPGAGVAGVVGEVADGVAELLVGGPAEVDERGLPDLRVESRRRPGRPMQGCPRSAVCRQIPSKDRIWDWSQPSMSLPVLNVSSTGQRRPAMVMKYSISSSARSFSNPDGPRTGTGSETMTSGVRRARSRKAATSPASRSAAGARAWPPRRPMPSKHTPIRSTASRRGGPALIPGPVIGPTLDTAPGHPENIDELHQAQRHHTQPHSSRPRGVHHSKMQVTNRVTGVSHAPALPRSQRHSHHQRHRPVVPDTCPIRRSDTGTHGHGPVAAFQDGDSAAGAPSYSTTRHRSLAWRMWSRTRRRPDREAPRVQAGGWSRLRRLRLFGSRPPRPGRSLRSRRMRIGFAEPWMRRPLPWDLASARKTGQGRQLRICQQWGVEACRGNDCLKG